MPWRISLASRENRTDVHSSYRSACSPVHRAFSEERLDRPGADHRRSLACLAVLAECQFSAALVLPGRQPAPAVDHRSRGSGHRRVLRLHFRHARLVGPPLRPRPSLLQFLLGFRCVHRELRRHALSGSCHCLVSDLLAGRPGQSNHRLGFDRNRSSAPLRRRRYRGVCKDRARCGGPPRQRKIPHFSGSRSHRRGCL